MVTKLTYRGILATIGNTPIVELQNMSPKEGVRIFAKLEGQNPTGSVKDRIALKMIEQAELDGEISSARTILEPTSGNTGISLAMIARLKGYKVRVVMPENVSVERVQLLQAYGAEIINSDGTRGTNGSIEMAHGLMEKNSHDYLMLYQYGNLANPGAHYETTGPEIVEALPDVAIFVAGLGTGGTLMGVARRLKEHNPRVKIVAVAPEPDDFYFRFEEPGGRIYTADTGPEHVGFQDDGQQLRGLSHDQGVVASRRHLCGHFLGLRGLRSTAASRTTGPRRHRVFAGGRWLEISKHQPLEQRL